MNSEHPKELRTIREAIQRGELTQQQLVERLNGLIDAEFAAQDHPADEAYIALCLDLLEQVQTGSQVEYVSRTDIAKAVVTNEYKHYLRGKHMRGMAVKVAAVAAILVLLLGTGFQHKWLSAQSTLDGQQYVLELKSVSYGTSSIADDEITIPEQPVHINTSVLQAALNACSFLEDFSPQPKLPYTDEHYEALIKDTWEEFLAYYRLENGSLLMNIRQYRSPDEETVRASFEQNGPGHYFQLTPDVKAYESRNYNRPFIVWYNDTMVCYVSGEVDADTCRDYARMLCEQLPQPGQQE